ncbi:MAG: GntR family transcriptional regulator [Acidobacteria bacterium]|nr:GntR family transcriptional regulator [Acidobacteriota bacterium]
MTFELRIEPAGPVPIWRQIEDGIRRGVASGELAPGGAVPSVRELAVALRVNPATVAKAYRRLVDSGILMVRRGEGTYVTELNENEVAVLRDHELLHAARGFAHAAKALGASPEDAADLVTRVWEETPDA